MKKSGVFFAILLVILCSSAKFEFVSSSVEGGAGGEEDVKVTKPGFSERLTSLLYVSSPASGSDSGSGSAEKGWDKVRALVNQARSYFSPPNLDFRGGSEENEPISHGEKVKEAAARSLEKSKVAVEDSAKSAAKIASETVEKVKKSVSGKHETKTETETDDHDPLRSEL